MCGIGLGVIKMLIISDKVSEVSAIVNNYYAEHNMQEEIHYKDYQQHERELPLYVRIAHQLARHRRNKHDDELQERIEFCIAELNKELPHGSGWVDSNIVEYEKTIHGGLPHKDDYFTLRTSYYHYNQNDYACGYSYWEVRIVAEFGSFDIRPKCYSGHAALKESGYSGFKDYLIDCFVAALNEEK